MFSSSKSDDLAPGNYSAQEESVSGYISEDQNSMQISLNLGSSSVIKTAKLVIQNLPPDVMTLIINATLTTKDSWCDLSLLAKLLKVLPETVNKVEFKNLTHFNLDLIDLFKSLPPTVHALRFSEGFRIVWDFGYEDSNEVNKGVFSEILKSIPNTLFKIDILDEEFDEEFVSSLCKTQRKAIENKLNQNLRRYSFVNTSASLKFLIASSPFLKFLPANTTIPNELREYVSKNSLGFNRS